MGAFGLDLLGRSEATATEDIARRATKDLVKVFIIFSFLLYSEPEHQAHYNDTKKFSICQ
jgi:hypothetical protein